MNRVRASITGIWLAFSFAACTNETPTPVGDTGGTSASTGGSPSGTGGTANPSGGTANPSGGTANPSGGTANPSGGTANPSGGTANPSGGTANPSGGTSNPSGGTANPSGGKATGGATGPTGGAANPSGGTATGGNATGGNATGGAATRTCITSASGAYWQTATVTTVSSGTADVTVNDTSTAQNWEGMGGSFNEMGWTYLQQLSAADRDRALQLLFGADGANFVIGRIPIGASDYATNRYTDDEVSGTDPNMTSFSITRDSQSLIPYIKAAMAIKSGMRFWASPWTPPTWMKTGPFQSGGTASNFDGGNMTDSDSVLKAHAQYFVKWIQAYGQQGITVEVIAPQNEPGYSQNYPSCLWTSALYTKFVGQYLGPALSTASLSTKIMLGTMSNNSSGKDPSIVSAVMADATAKGYIKYIGLQWGMLENYASQYKSSYSSVPMWATEHKCGNYPWNPSGSPAYVEPAPNNHAYAVESWGYIKNAINNGVTAYNAWNMVLDTMGKGIDTARQWAQDSLLVVNTSSKTLTIAPAYYVFRHISQFAAPGGKVVGTSGGDAVAFKNPDGSIVAVMYNSGAAKTSIVSIAGQRLQFSMPGNGWATCKY
jgi:glucosylceramidase